jgi:single-strand DNA-binding protein
MNPEEGNPMSRSVNKIILVGNIGRDPDIQTTASGQKVAHVALATTHHIPRDDRFEERTEWHRLTLWNGLATLAEEHLRKGDLVYVDGRMEYDSFEANGVTIPTAEVVVHEIVLLRSSAWTRA